MLRGGCRYLQTCFQNIFKIQVYLHRIILQQIKKFFIKHTRKLELMMLWILIGVIQFTKILGFAGDYELQEGRMPIGGSI